MSVAQIPHQILDPTGHLVADNPVPVERLRQLYAAMVVARTYDRKCSALQRQGRLATYAQFEGQEAAQIGAVRALRPSDWVVATYRDAAAMWAQGYPWVNLLLGRTGDERGGHAPAGVPVLPPSITVGAHMIHAVGIGWAVGQSWATGQTGLSDGDGADGVAMTFFGDGATSEGDFHEAMNFAAVFATPTVFVCQNNGWAISMPRDRQTRSATIAQKADAYGMPGVLVDGNDLLAVHAASVEAVERARRGEGPTLIEAVTYRIGPHTTADDDGRYRPGDERSDWQTRDPLDRVRLHLASLDAWSEEWQREVETAASADIEAAVAEAEALEPFEAAATFDGMFAAPTSPISEQRRLASGEAAAAPDAEIPAESPAGPEGPSSERNLAQALNSALDHALDDPDVVLIGEDVGRTGGVFRISDGLQQRHGAHRVIDTPVAESAIVGTVFGMAVAGMRPIAEIQFMGFSYPGYDQVVSHVARIRNRSRHRFTAPLVIRIPYGAGIGAAEHHSESTEVIYTHIPGLKVVVPSNPYDAKGLLLAAVADPDPVIFLEPIRLYRAIKGQVPDGPYQVPIGVAAVERHGDDVTLIGYGAMMREIRQAAVVLDEQGISATTVDLRTLSPLDVETIVATVQHTGRAVVVHEAPRTAGLAGEIIAVIQEQALYSLQAPVERVTGWDTVVPLRRAEHHYVPSVERIVAAVRRTLES